MTCEAAPPVVVQGIVIVLVTQLCVLPVVDRAEPV